jgi:hypothetical protein
MSALLVSRIIATWMIIILTILLSYIFANTEQFTGDTTFYRFGPNPELVILGIVIDTAEKYCLVVLYAIINTIIRNLDHNIIAPYITLNVQNINAPNNDIKEIPKQYEVSIINTIYSWFDWLIYINMLLAQVDMFLLELTTDVIAIYFVTGWYIKNRTAIEAIAAMQTETTEANEANEVNQVNLVPTTFVSH